MPLAAIAIGGMMATADAHAAQGTVTAHKQYGYPYPNAPDCYEGAPYGHGGACALDRWRFYQGQCTSWVAYRLNQRSHVSFSNEYKRQHFGDATSWGAAAKRLKIPVNGKPAVGAVAWYSSGHVGYVEKTSPRVVISEMNFDYRNGFRTKAIGPGNHWPTGFIHIKDLKPKKPKKPKDTDKDGVPDSKDKCKRKKGPKSNGGCPRPKATRVTVNGFYNPLSGDFDGDRYSDIFWYGPGGAHDSLWYGQASSSPFVTAVPVTVNGAYTPLTGDFNGDGRSDVFWYGPGDSHDSLWYGQSGLGSFIHP
jgi:surface antigen